ncbi:hypothetical protein KGF56_003987 [Candida oxycetoniae]|uniref:SAM-dependent MTase RsmB/NOP-type domain-containing protein n=1 Tax=Candida oxycetoniae TaxID=497107 RepID=A0AAI9WWP2_9ASCO|nr:uncharacterized protein KGF56_003987 [Candida oxycetoniae]KAI3403217.2 hypothetical protein KGF56_003987 [Candida oxycetoniae]
MKLYFEAERFLKDGGKFGGSLKSRIFSDTKLKNSPKHIFALVCSTIKYYDFIHQIVQKSKIKQELKQKKVKVSDELLALIIHDLLFSSRGRIESGKHPIKDAILGCKTRLQAEFIKLKLRYKVTSVCQLPVNEDTNDDETPVRWFRINTIKVDQERFFKKHKFFTDLQPVNRIEELIKPGLVFSDDYIPNLYGVHPREKLSSTDAYKLGEIIIQDRASCFPAHILNEDNQYVHKQVIDACAAPGNKTTHAASHLPLDDASAVVYAIERDAKRVGVLRTMCEKATGKNKKKLIQVIHKDFTTIQPEDFSDVTGLIVDPSCSGSGIFGRAMDNALNGEKKRKKEEEEEEEEKSNEPHIDQERLRKLASFQNVIMKHALSFPGAQRVVYSTCSIHAEENERVVIDLLSDPEVREQGWTLARRQEVLPTWPRRGFESEFIRISRDEKVCKELADGCVRAKPKEDGGIGFFAACFVKRGKLMVDEEKSTEDISEEQNEWLGFED